MKRRDGGGMRTGGPSLWVCWSKPPVRPEEGVRVLSFLSPSDEDDFVELCPQVILAREASKKVRARASRLYVDLVARIGTAPSGSSRSLRLALSPPGQTSRWWYHLVSFKDCEADPTFKWIIAVLTVQSVARDCGAERLVLFAAPSEVVEALAAAFNVDDHATVKPRRGWLLCLRGFASRAAYALRSFRHWQAIRRLRETVSDPMLSVAFTGFWDWSVWRDERTGALSDRYFKCLPDEMKAQGVSPVGWLVWLDSDAEPGKKGRPLREVLAPLVGSEHIVILQRFLHLRDIVQALGNLSYVATFLRARRQPAFRKLFHHEGLDLYPLFSSQLLAGFVNSSIPHCELVALATERACASLKPRVSLTFLEHFPYARAHYEGVRRAGVGTVNYAVQHASYNHEKTFVFLQPSLEFNGEPDGCRVPHPDYVCVMGALGRDLFLECGYSQSQVLLTGSPRYDHVRPVVDQGRCGTYMATPRADEDVQVLIVCSLDVDLEMEMVEAVWAATKGIKQIRLFLRCHPFSRVDEHPRFAAYRNGIKVTHGSLQEDLDRADVILFTYSTVAEEALMQGKPVWQWLPLEFNGSALGETVAIPQFGSVEALRQALREFCATPGRFTPAPETSALVLDRLFFRGDGMAAQRVAGAIAERLGIGAVAHEYSS